MQKQLSSLPVLSETLKNNFAALSKSKLELQELHSCLTQILDDLRLNHKVAVTKRAEVLQDNKNLLAKKREMIPRNEEVLKEKEMLEESYLILQEISQLAQTNSHISANLLWESQSENHTLRKDKSKLTLKIREVK